MSENYRIDKLPLDPWYFPRTSLANHVLSVFGSGVVHRLALFAPRRFGKTLFLLRDLAPAGLAADMVPAYASLWEDIDSPQRPLLSALTAAVDATRTASGLGDYLQRIGQLTVSAGLVKAQLDTRPEKATRSSDEELERLDQLLRTLTEVSGDRRVLLMIDEAQYLAVSDAFRPLLAALRSALDRQEAIAPGRIHVVFTSSSRTDLRAMLDDPAAPFYRSVEQLELAPLDRQYTDFVARQLAQLGPVHVDSDRLFEVFKAFHHSPYYLQQLVVKLMLRNADSVDDAYSQVLADFEADPLLRRKLTSMSELDIAVYDSVCVGDGVHAASSMRAFAEHTGGPVTKAQVEASRARLSRLSIISERFAARGYQNEGPVFRAALKRSRGQMSLGFGTVEPT